MRRQVVIFAASCAGLIAFVYLAIWAFNGFHGLGLSLNGAIALALGSALTVALGVGLMALIFYGDSQ